MTQEEFNAALREVVDGATIIVGSLLASITVQRPGFDINSIQITIPRTYEGTVNTLLGGTIERAIMALLPKYEEHIRADEREKIAKGLTRR